MPPKTVLCFGDSLTWGWIPAAAATPTQRYARGTRWTGVLADTLGDEYLVIEEGLSARTTNVDDPTDPRLNGAAYLPGSLASHLPLDLVILMLGTNDLKVCFGRTPFDIATGMSILTVQVLTSAGGIGTTYPAPKVLVVAPPPLGSIPDPWFRMMFDGGHEKSAALADAYRAMTSFFKVPFFDAGSVIRAEGIDGIHLTEDNNRDLGEALAIQVRQLLS